MSAEPPPAFDEDRLSSLLADLDDVLADGASSVEGVALPASATLRDDLAYLRLLREALKSPSAGPPTASGLPWSRLGRFELRRELGRGGCGIVYLAYDPLLGREVALKVPRPELAVAPDFRDRFHREARAAAGLDHPNLLPLYEAGEAGPVCFLVYAYCPGPTLAQWLTGRAEPVPFRLAAEIVAAVADAVEHAHGRGVIHRDLKPSNVILEKPPGALPAWAGVPKVADFGLAKSLLEASAAHLTRSGDVVGTVAYMAPEQAAGKSKDIDRAADVYALGVILYELLTGRPPFQGETDLDTLQQVRWDEPSPPSRYRPGCPRDLVTVCLKCLEKEPRRRYARAADLADDLRRYLGGHSIRARRVSTVERLGRWVRRNPAPAAVVALGAVAFLALVALAVGYAFVVQQAQAAEKVRGERAQTEAALRDAEVQRARLALERGMTLCEQGDVARGLLWLARGLKTAPADAGELQHAARANLTGWGRQLHPLRAAFRHPAVIYALAISPNGRLGATGDETGHVQIWEAATGRPVGPLVRHPDTVRALAFSPDGRLLAGAYDNRTARLWDVATHRPVGPELRHKAGDGGVCWDVAFSPDGRLLASCSDDGVRLWRTKDGEPVGAPLRDEEMRLVSVAFSPDGQTLVAGGPSGRANLFDVATGRRRVPTEQHLSTIWRVAFRGDGALAVTASWDGTARLWDVTSGQPFGPVLSHTGAVHAAAFNAIGQILSAARLNAVAFSPDGRTLATASEDGRCRLWSVTADPGPPTNLPHQGGVTDVAFRADGQVVATASRDGTARLWDARTGQPLGPALAHRDMVVRVGFAGAAGRVLVTASADGTVRLWEATGGRALGTILSHGDAVSSVAFSPDGRTALTGSWDGTARLWDETTGALMGSWKLGQHVNQVAFSPDGRTAVAAGAFGLQALERGPEGFIARVFPYGMMVLRVAFSPDGRRLVAGVADNAVQVWDVAAGQTVGPDRPMATAVYAAAYSPDGLRFAAGSRDGAVQLYDAARGKPVGEPAQHRSAILGLAFSPDGRVLLAGSGDGTARLYAADTGRPLGPPLEHDARVLAVAFRPDGRAFATAAADGTARLWSVEGGGTPLGRPMEHAGAVLALAFSGDGRLLATVAADGTSRLWDGDTGQSFSMPVRHEGQVMAVAIHPNGRRVLTGSRDGTARLWEPPAPADGSPERLELWAQVVTGLELDDAGLVRVLDAPVWQQREKSLAELRASPSRP